ncbi:ring finger protein-like [Mantella aurantiaca]
MAHPVIPYEDQGHGQSKFGEIHGLTSNSGEENNAGQDLDLTEIITVEDKENGINLETLPLVNHVNDQLENTTLSNTNKLNLINPANIDFDVMSPFTGMDNCVTIPNNSEIKRTESLSLHLDLHDLTTSKDVDLDDDDNNLVGQVEVHDLPRTSDDFSSPDDVPENQVESTKDLEVEELQASSKLLMDEDHFEKECPICTELYDANNHKQSLLNCNHVFCDNCIKTMVIKANEVNLGKVTCPLCRQTTPMMEWEIRKMQDQMLDSGGTYIQQDYVTPEAIVRRPGLCGALEYRFQKRFRNGRLIGFPPCIRHPQRLVERLNRLQHRCRCLYLVALVFLLFIEFFCFFFLFLPIIIFILLIVFGK